MSSKCEYDWYWKISACSTEYEVCDSFASLTSQQTSYSGSTGWYFRYQSIHITYTYSDTLASYVTHKHQFLMTNSLNPTLDPDYEKKLLSPFYSVIKQPSS